jgi:hypothetical protein
MVQKNKATFRTTVCTYYEGTISVQRTKITEMVKILHNTPSFYGTTLQSNNFVKQSVHTTLVQSQNKEHKLQILYKYYTTHQASMVQHRKATISYNSLYIPRWYNLRTKNTDYRNGISTS